MTKTTLSFLLACMTFASVPAAHAVGTRIDVQVVDRTTGETLTPVLYRGEWWIAGRPGARYGVYLRNRTGGNTENVLSIDGVNAVTGENADWRQTGYILRPNAGWRIDGWRKNENEVAAFEFTNLPDAYATRTGRPGNVGVIGVAVFAERAPDIPVAPVPAITMPPPRSVPPVPPVVEPAASGSSGAARDLATNAPAAPPRSMPCCTDARAKADAAPPSMEERAPSATSVAPARNERLGTGHGALETSVVTYVDFVRAKPVPTEIVILHYDRRENLVARGILPPATGLPVASANPFPDNHRFVADPPPRP